MRAPFFGGSLCFGNSDKNHKYYHFHFSTEKNNEQHFKSSLCFSLAPNKRIFTASAPPEIFLLCPLPAPFFVQRLERTKQKLRYFFIGILYARQRRSPSTKTGPLPRELSDRKFFDPDFHSRFPIGFSLDKNRQLELLPGACS